MKTASSFPKTREGVRARDGHYAFDLLDVCQAVHMSLAGASDALENFDDHVGWLRARLESWKPGLVTSSGYDDAVKALLVAVLAEVDRAEKAAP